MGTNWIKMGVDLRTNPKVVKMAAATRSDRLRVLGALFATWCVFDAHSSDGRLDGYTPEALDDELGWRGFSRAMAAVGWLEIEPGGLRAPRFEEHNGTTAKRRALDSSRKGRVRKTSASDADISPPPMRTETGQVSASDADKMRNREEKRREELLTPGESEGVDVSRARSLPHHWKPGAELLDFTRQIRPEWTQEALSHEVAQFVDHYASTGEKRADWDAAWRKWVRGSRASGPKGSSSARTDPAAIDALLGNRDATH